MPPEESRDDNHVRFVADRAPSMRPLRQTATALRRPSFARIFVQARGPPQILLMIIFLAMGYGATVGVVPAVMTDRFARLEHRYDDPRSCGDPSYEHTIKPEACLQGSSDAQNTVAWEQLLSNLFCFFSSPVMGSLSDAYGRKVILIPGLIVASLSPLCLVLIQLNPSMSPLWYYATGTLTGIVGWIAVSLSALADAMPPKWRAPSFGLLMAGMSMGFALSPQLAFLCGIFAVSVWSLLCMWIGLIIAMVWLPETVSPEAARQARRARDTKAHEFSLNNTNDDSEGMSYLQVLYRPFWELSILNRNRLFRLLSCLAFFSGMVSAADRTLLVYYVEERLHFTLHDVANLFLLSGVLGILVQSIVLKLFNDCVGERWVVFSSFLLGTVTNFMYGLATTKSVIFGAAAIGSFSGMAFPTISAIKANNVQESEQGRIQGALYSLQALASGLGPMTMRFVYHYTRDGAWVGPGSMFVAASLVYLIAVYFAWLLPVEANSTNEVEGEECTSDVSTETSSLL